MTVLIVEDNLSMLRLYKMMLESEGFHTFEANNGEKAVNVYKSLEEKPDIILMDLSLPKMDGWEATKRIKADDELKNIPVIAITAHAMSGDEEKALEHGCDGYLAKPCTPGSVIDIVKKFLKVEE